MQKNKRTQKIRSSETTRETPKRQFDFTAFSTNASTNKSTVHVTDIQKKRNQALVTNERKFLEWFIGFFEAEGCSIYWTDGRIRFRIEVTQQDKDLIDFIQKQFGFGSVTYLVTKNANPCWRYAVEDFSGLLQMIDLLNGNLVLQKRQTVFKKWLLVFNGLPSATNLVAKQPNKQLNTQVVYKKQTPQFTLTDGWLSGFLEGDGGFYISKNFIRINKKSRAYALKMRFFVTQKDGPELIARLRSLLNVVTPLRDRVNKVIDPKTNEKKERRYDLVDTATLESAKIILEYLTRFPFLGKRQITVDSWKELMEYRITKYPITAETTAIIQKLVNQTKKVENELEDSQNKPSVC